MTRIVGVSRILNEAEMIEPFIRHHATMLDLHLVLDGGSTDRTLPILQALHAEGIPLQVFQSTSPVFVEQILNTGLYRLALEEGADWVCFLDADELLQVQGGPEDLRQVLELVPGGIACLQVPAYRYAAGPDDPGLHAFVRLTQRDPAPHMTKLIARRLDPARIAIYAGNHGAFIDGVPDAGLPQDRLALAHFPDRSPLQMAGKIILGRMKAAASGAEVASEVTLHVLEDFQALQQDPRRWLEQVQARLAGAEGLVEAPAAYHGGDLRYTTVPDDLARLLGHLAAATQALAASHGRILDEKRLVRGAMLKQGAMAKRLL